MAVSLPVEDSKFLLKVLLRLAHRFMEKVDIIRMLSSFLQNSQALCQILLDRLPGNRIDVGHALQSEMVTSEIGLTQGMQENTGLVPALHVATEFDTVGWQQVRD